MDGIIEREIEGKVRQFRFGTYTLKIIADEFKERNLNNVMNRLAYADVPFWVSFAYACAKTVCNDKKETPDFTEADVYVWADQIGVSEFEKIITSLLETYKEKNVKAPETAGQS